MAHPNFGPKKKIGKKKGGRRSIIQLTVSCLFDVSSSNMPRQAPLDAAGVLHHVMIRGIERRNIFRSDRDRNDFIDRLASLLPDTKTACYAWAFLPNQEYITLFPSVICSAEKRLEVRGAKQCTLGNNVSKVAPDPYVAKNLSPLS